MIAEDMPVQIRRCGTAVPVQRLVIGDLLYDPLSDNYLEIVDILSRDNTRLEHQLARIPAGRFGAGRPRQDVILSRHQAVAYAERNGASGPVRLEFGAAHQLGEAFRMKTRLFALFPERRGCICVDGALVRLDVWARHGGGNRGRAGKAMTLAERLRMAGPSRADEPPAEAGGRMVGLVLLGILTGALCLGAALLLGLGPWAVALAYPAGGGCALMLGAVARSRWA